MKAQDLEKIILPTDYEVSRVQMTKSKYRVDRAHSKSGPTRNEIIGNFDFLAFRKEQESRIVFFEPKYFKNTKTIAEKILKIITSPKYRAGSLHVIKLEKYQDELLGNIQYFIEKNEPIQFMFPAFPFKIRNPLKSSRGDADLAEVASFCKLNEIHLQIQRIYSKGAQFNIFHDGHLYYRHFLHSQEDADTYFYSLKMFAKKLGLEDVVKVKDAFEVLKKFKDFSGIYKIARGEMDALWSRGKDVDERILKIRKSADDNINLSDIPKDILIEILTKTIESLPKKIIVIQKEIEKKADLCAFEYMVVQHALEKMKFFLRAVPHGIRLSVHPKEGQIGIHLVKKTTFLLPWMGCGVLKQNGEASVRYETELLGNPSYVPVFIKGQDFPFFYKKIVS